MGMPAWVGFRRTLGQRQARTQLIQAIRAARQTAVTQHRQVVMAFGVPPTTTNIGTYSVHIDTDGDRFQDSGERWTPLALPNGVKLTQVALDPTDSLIFDPSGSLYPGGTGGTLIFSNGRNAPDTLMVSSVGMVFRP
jgi:type II secretory pathway pseudopilin PulG